MEKYCKTCGCKIPKERLEILPETETCVEHSTVLPYRGFITTGNKLGKNSKFCGNLMIVPGELATKLGKVRYI